MLLNTAAWMERSGRSAWPWAVILASFGWRHKFASASKPRLSTRVIEKLVGCWRLWLFKPSVVFVLKVVSAEIVSVLILVLFAIFAELIIFYLPLFVGILVLVSKLTFFGDVFLELIASRHKPTGSRWFVLSLLIVVITWRSSWEIPFVLGELFLNLH